MKNKVKIDDDMMLTRAVDMLDLRAVTTGDDNKIKTIDGHPAVFGKRANIGGWYEEIIERGAFDETDFDDVLLCINHETRKIPLARSRRNNANSTMQLKTDDIGLAFKADLDTERNAEALQLYSSIERGDMDGMSFIFRVGEDKWENLDTNLPTRRILRVAKVYEVCAATWPAYEETDINARDKQALENAKLALENARRSKELENSKAAVDIYKLKNKILGGL